MGFSEGRGVAGETQRLWSWGTWIVSSAIEIGREQQQQQQQKTPSASPESEIMGLVLDKIANIDIKSDGLLGRVI